MRRIPAEVGREELTGCHELVVAAGDLRYGHDAAGSLGNGLHRLAVKGEATDGALLLHTDEEALGIRAVEGADGIGQVHLGDYLLGIVHLYSQPFGIVWL